MTAGGRSVETARDAVAAGRARAVAERGVVLIAGDAGARHAVRADGGIAHAFRAGAESREIVAAAERDGIVPGRGRISAARIALIAYRAAFIAERRTAGAGGLRIGTEHGRVAAARRGVITARHAEIARRRGAGTQRGGGIAGGFRISAEGRAVILRTAARTRNAALADGHAGRRIGMRAAVARAAADRHRIGALRDGLLTQGHGGRGGGCAAIADGHARQARRRAVVANGSRIGITRCAGVATRHRERTAGGGVIAECRAVIAAGIADLPERRTAAAGRLRAIADGGVVGRRTATHARDAVRADSNVAVVIGHGGIAVVGVVAAADGDGIRARRDCIRAGRHAKTAGSVCVLSVGCSACRCCFGSIAVSNAIIAGRTTIRPASNRSRAAGRSCAAGVASARR